MGQQQLLLLVLATVIVGLATVAGIQAFDQGQTRANQDALTNTAVKIASDVQANLQKPKQFGGYGLDDASNYPDGETEITLGDLGYTTNSDNAYETSDGKCGITTGGSAAPANISDDNGLTTTDAVIAVTCESGDNEVVASVEGLNSEDIVSGAATLGS